MNKKDAIQAMLEGKKVQLKVLPGEIICFHEGKFLASTINSSWMSIDMNDLPDREWELYQEPPKAREFQFECWLGENPKVKPNTARSVIAKHVGHHTSYTFDDDELNKWPKISKWQVTMKEILE